MRPVMLGVAVALAVVVLAGTSTSLRPAAGAPAQPEVQFTVTGVGRVGLEPDFAIVVFAVRAISRTAQGAVTENAKATDGLLKALRTFARAGDRIESAGFQVSPERGAFVVVNQVQVRTTQVREIGRLIDLAVRAGADDVGGIAFGRDNTREAAQQAIREAMQQARENADAVAAGLGLRIAHVVSIEPSLEQIEGPLAARPYAREQSTVIEPARLTLTAHVRVHFVLGP